MIVQELFDLSPNRLIWTILRKESRPCCTWQVEGAFKQRLGSLPFLHLRVHRVPLVARTATPGQCSNLVSLFSARLLGPRQLLLHSSPQNSEARQLGSGGGPFLLSVVALRRGPESNPRDLRSRNLSPLEGPLSDYFPALGAAAPFRSPQGHGASHATQPRESGRDSSSWTLPA